VGGTPSERRIPLRSSTSRATSTCQDCDRAQDVAATRAIVRTLRARGFRFVTIPQRIADAQPRHPERHVAAR